MKGKSNSAASAAYKKRIKSLRRKLKKAKQNLNRANKTKNKFMKKTKAQHR